MHLRNNDHVTPQLLLQYAREFEKSEMPLPLPVTETDLWKFWCVTNSQKNSPDLLDVGLTYFGCTPWEQGGAPGPSKTADPFSYVLVAGGLCPAEDRESYLSYWPTYGPGMSDDTFAAFMKIHCLIFVKHGINNVIFRRVDSLEHFWDGFYGHDDFLGVENGQLRVPAIIITNGWLPSYSDRAGKPNFIFPRLLEIGRETGIPVELT